MAALVGMRYIVIGSLLASVLLLTNFGIKQLREGPDIVWQIKELEKTVVQGAVVSEDIGFISHKDLGDVRVWVAPEIEKFVLVKPALFNQIPAGSLVRIQVIFSVPEDLAPGEYEGTIHIRSDQKTIARPLPIELEVRGKKPPGPSPKPEEEIELFFDDGTAEGLDFDPVLGRAVLFNKFSIPGQKVEIETVKIFFKVVTQPPSPIDLHVWDANRQPLIAPVRVTFDEFDEEESEKGKKKQEEEEAECGPKILQGDWCLIDLSSKGKGKLVANEFFLGMSWASSAAPPLLGVDFSSPQGQSFVVLLPTNTFISLVDANIMIRAIVKIR